MFIKIPLDKISEPEYIKTIMRTSLPASNNYLNFWEKENIYKNAIKSFY